LLLIWSNAARNSEWVEEEWTNAKSLKKAIIPCILDKAPLPGILASRAYLDFRNIDQGKAQLLHALNLAQQPIMPTASQVAEPVARVIHHQLQEAPAPAKPKPPQLLLRVQPLDELSGDGVQQMLKERVFYDASWNKSGRGLRHEYEAIERHGDNLVIDHTTGLTWQQSGSPNDMNYADAEKYIRDLNEKRFAGYNDWRLPTLEEAMSLMEPNQTGKLYLDPVFDRRQWWLWTADKYSASSAWYVHFVAGICGHVGVHSYYFVRGVREDNRIFGYLSYLIIFLARAGDRPGRSLENFFNFPAVPANAPDCGGCPNLTRGCGRFPPSKFPMLACRRRGEPPPISIWRHFVFLPNECRH
jgi:hypothetical protein